MSVTLSAQDLLAEIEATRDDTSRRDLLRKACDLFEVSEPKLSERETELFDDVLGILSHKVDVTMKAEFSKRVADKGSALANTLEALAFDDEIAIARPVLQRSSNLTDETLVEIAQQKGQAHMAAIADRSELNPMVTDTLVELGDQTVLRTVARNSGAKFSEPGMGTLTEKSRDDEALQHFISERDDLSLIALERLVDLATDRIRNKISEKAANAGQVVNAARLALEKELGIDRVDFLTADRRVRMLARKRPLDETALRSLSDKRFYAELVVALSVVLRVDLNHAKRVMMESNALLVSARANEYAPDTVDSMLRVGPTFEKLSEEERQVLLQEYLTITPETAQRVMRFWRTRTKLAA